MKNDETQVWVEIEDPTFDKIEKGDRVTSKSGDVLIAGIAVEERIHAWLTGSGCPIAAKSEASWKLLHIERQAPPDYEFPDPEKQPIIWGLAAVGDEGQYASGYWVARAGNMYEGDYDNCQPEDFTEWQAVSLDRVGPIWKADQ